jgi:peptidoglycan hydrolase-like protein with peptidoglycan-binding domain
MATALQGLDCAAAPPAAKAKQMLDAIGGHWWNVYIGGPSAKGTGSESWTPELVREYVRHGIKRFMVTYAGHQRTHLTPSQGQTDAREALELARRFGYSGDFPLCLDIEMITFTPAPTATTEYVRGWCTAVRKAGARPGVYANPGPLQTMHAGKIGADFVWIASWVNRSVTDHNPHSASSMPVHLWAKHGQRAWQYAGSSDRNKPCQVLGINVDISVADPGCLAHAPGVSASPAKAVPHRPRALRRGARGAVVVRLTHRLSVVRSRQTRRPYLDGPRRNFDAETEAALKAFQRDHGIAASGAYGRASARALLRAAKRETARRDIAHKVSPAGRAGAKPAIGATRLPDLVKAFQRLDAEADRAWQLLEAYGKKRAGQLARLPAHDDGDLAGVTDALDRIEHQLALLVELERHEVELEERALQAPQTVAVHVGELPASTTVPVPAPVPAAAAAAVAHPRRRLADLSDKELDGHIDVLDRRLDRSRKERIARYARVEKQLVPHVQHQIPGPARKGKPGARRTPGGHVAKGAAKPKPHHPGGGAGRNGSGTRPRPGTDEVRNLQRSLNRFTERFVDGLAPLVVDGTRGTETDKRIRSVKYYLGYGVAERTTAVTPRFIRRLRHPHSARFSSARLLARAARRRRKQRKAALRLASGPIEGTPKHVIDTIVLPIAAECGIPITPAVIATRNATHGHTDQGNISDHEGPPARAWAADISNGGSPTPEMDEVARRLAKRFDIEWHDSGAATVTHGGYRYQLHYRTMIGGNHFNHVHFGLKVV